MCNGSGSSSAGGYGGGTSGMYGQSYGPSMYPQTGGYDQGPSTYARSSPQYSMYPQGIQGPRTMDGGPQFGSPWTSQGLRYAPPGMKAPSGTNPDGTQFRTMFSRLPPGMESTSDAPLPGQQPQMQQPTQPTGPLDKGEPIYFPGGGISYNFGQPMSAAPAAATAPQTPPTMPGGPSPSTAGTWGMVPNDQNNAWVPRTPEYDQKAIWQNPFIQTAMRYNPNTPPEQLYPSLAGQFANNPYNPFK